MSLVIQKVLLMFQIFILKVVLKKPKKPQSCKTLARSTGKCVFLNGCCSLLTSLFLQDPEALAQLMKSVPLTNDGKFMLLNDVSEEDGTMHEGGEESEA